MQGCFGFSREKCPKWEKSVPKFPLNQVEMIDLTTNWRLYVMKITRTDLSYPKNYEKYYIAFQKELRARLKIVKMRLEKRLVYIV
ncbi:MAG: hypothetical protein RBG13Loki_3930 [Promethearchaeota archaeon CR_4]|nr:MAG: hypothetical protein RBG13Loki_3930 [Candidatus Lokiarchaeota archaeon CR_4]